MYTFVPEIIAYYLDELDAHLASEEGVFEVGRVGDARREDDHRRLGAGRPGGRCLQGGQQLGGIAGDGLHPVAEERLGEHPRHGAPVLDHIGDAGRDADVVLEHAEPALGVFDEVDAGDVDTDVVSALHTVGVTPEVPGRRNEVARDDGVGKDGSGAVGVGEEHLEGPHALGDSLLDRAPLVRHDEPGDRIERKGALLARQGERDALVAEGPVALGAALVEVAHREGAEILVEAEGGLARLAGPVEHLVPGGAGLVALEKVVHVGIS
jgi:hypothetical protein